MVLPSFVAGQSKTANAPSQRLNIALVGVGGRGSAHLSALIDENIVALCDVDIARAKPQLTNRSSEGDRNHVARIEQVEKKGAKWFADYREMLEEMGDEIDAVVVCTPDHMHYPIAMSAINRGKHVYVEKPLTHTVDEARLLMEAARKKGVITQMGNQGHSMEGVRLVKEWIQAGVIGEIREVHSWTNRPIWPQGINRPDHSKFIPVTPKTLHWDLWLGVADHEPYDPEIAHFNWRGFFPFGTGAFGDMACHIMDPAYYALEPGWPTAIEAFSTPTTDFSFPKASVVKYEFPSNGKRAAFDYTWYSGGLLPPRPKGLSMEDVQHGDTSGTYYIGDEGVMYTSTYGADVQILPLSRFQELRRKLPPKTIPRIKGSHQKHWADCIRDGGEPASNFDYASPFSEMVLLGPIAERLRTRLEIDPEKRRFKNSDEANALLTKEYPKGWILT